MIAAEILNRHCDRALRRPFSWGTDDCCTFACDVIEEAFSLDLMGDLAGRYGSEAEAAAALYRFAGGGLAETALALALRHGLEPVAFPFASADIAVIAESHGPMLAVSDGTSWIARGREGVVRLPLWRAVLAWRVAESAA
jgi:hypothetical protein